MKRKSSYDFYLILATALVLFAISVISIYGMFYFKFAQIQQMAPAIKFSYMNRMNSFVTPFIIILILLLGICVPKRLLPTAWLNRVTVLLVAGTVLTAFLADIKTSLLVILGASLFLQVIVLTLALAGIKNLNFHKKGYWVRLGSSLIHLGFILLVLDLLLYERKILHLFLFWVTTGASVAGMLFCFYAEVVVSFITGKKYPSGENNI
ncbi:MAG: hypothetical protein AMJ61_14000 [Desulfobacterales bacterium SG8_35_2]|nr:MAG: hypothetical protein AMJ61_14000 [Desulfobacterales bacterium SG8_35_2]